jgi:hypothetical protein
MNKKQISRSENEKVANEKPISLSPLGFKEAIAALLKVKPKPKEEKTEEHIEKSPAIKLGLCYRLGSVLISTMLMILKPLINPFDIVPKIINSLIDTVPTVINSLIKRISEIYSQGRRGRKAKANSCQYIAGVN